MNEDTTYFKINWVGKHINKKKILSGKVVPINFLKTSTLDIRQGSSPNNRDIR